jgi:DNA-binding transcriptional LysR family regulator
MTLVDWLGPPETKPARRRDSPRARDDALGMKLAHVRYFLVLLKVQNFAAAAKQCGIAKPTLSMAMKKLERRIGAALFLRRPRCKATPLALRLQPYFKKISDAVHVAEMEIVRHRKEKNRP